MAHFAEIIDGVVERVIVADTKEWCENNLGNTWVQTSYNTHGGTHTQGGTPLHKNYAGIGYTFDGTGFAAPQPYSSWTLNIETYLWEAPVAMPEDGLAYTWNEDDLAWVELITPTE
jgi:hypothetical protein